MPAKPKNPAVCAVQLRSAVMHLSRQLRAGMQRDGLPTAMLSVLSQLYRGGNMTPTELARREGVKLQSLTRLLAELESVGWIQRTVHVADARQSLLAISQLGKQRLGEAAKGADVPLAQAIAAHCSLDEQALLLRAGALLARLSDALQDTGDTA